MERTRWCCTPRLQEKAIRKEGEPLGARGSAGSVPSQIPLTTLARHLPSRCNHLEQRSLRAQSRLRLICHTGTATWALNGGITKTALTYARGRGAYWLKTPHCWYMDWYIYGALWIPMEPYGALWSPMEPYGYMTLFTTTTDGRTDGRIY